MKLLVTGAGGQLGRAVLSAAAARGAEVTGRTHAELAVEDPDAVRQAVASSRPDLVVHCAAWTAVDACEGDPERADLINGHGTAFVAQACRSVGSGLVYLSTDFVFDGRQRTPYGVEVPADPLSAYGRSKLLGEQAVLADPWPRSYVVRSSWVFGPQGANFPAAILRRARNGEPLRVVDDQVGCPTLTLDLAGAILDLWESGAEEGVYHAANEGHCSWYGFAREVLAAAGLDREIVPIESAELDRPAPRPAWSVLDCAKLTRLRGRPLPDYRDAIARYLAEEVAT